MKHTGWTKKILYYLLIGYFSSTLWARLMKKTLKSKFIPFYFRVIPVYGFMAIDPIYKSSRNDLMKKYDPQTKFSKKNRFIAWKWPFLLNDGRMSQYKNINNVKNWQIKAHSILFRLIYDSLIYGHSSFKKWSKTFCWEKYNDSQKVVRCLQHTPFFIAGSGNFLDYKKPFEPFLCGPWWPWNHTPLTR